MTAYAIFDIDGCVSDDRHRRHLLPVNGTCQDDFEPYHEQCSEDPVMNAGYVQEHERLGHKIVFLTSRPVKYRAATKEWLAKHFGKEWLLGMRPIANQLASPQVKEFLIESTEIEAGQVDMAYDDRQDVLDMYSDHGIPTTLLTYPVGEVEASVNCRTKEILLNAAHTFALRDEEYGSNWRQVAPIMRSLFPRGLPDGIVFEDHWHLFELLVVKLTRFANSGLEHRDSIHDAAVYCAMIEAILLENENEQ
jgi:hypothetical protein